MFLCAGVAVWDKSPPQSRCAGPKGPGAGVIITIPQSGFIGLLFISEIIERNLVVLKAQHGSAPSYISNLWSLFIMSSRGSAVLASLRSVFKGDGAFTVRGLFLIIFLLSFPDSSVRQFYLFSCLNFYWLFIGLCHIVVFLSFLWLLQSLICLIPFVTLVHIKQKGTDWHF